MAETLDPRERPLSEASLGKRPPDRRRLRPSRWTPSLDVGNLLSRKEDGEGSGYSGTPAQDRL